MTNDTYVLSVRVELREFAAAVRRMMDAQTLAREPGAIVHDRLYARDHEQHVRQWIRAIRSEEEPDEPEGEGRGMNGIVTIEIPDDVSVVDDDELDAVGSPTRRDRMAFGFALKLVDREYWRDAEYVSKTAYELADAMIAEAQSRISFV